MVSNTATYHTQIKTTTEGKQAGNGATWKNYTSANLISKGLWIFYSITMLSHSHCCYRLQVWEHRWNYSRAWELAEMLADALPALFGANTRVIPHSPTFESSLMYSTLFLHPEPDFLRSFLQHDSALQWYKRVYISIIQLNPLSTRLIV